MPDDEAAPQWGTKAVLERLASATPPSENVSVQLFLSEAVPPGEIASYVAKVVGQAAERLGIAPGAVQVGKALKMSRSVSLTAPLTLIEQIAGQSEIIDLLPGDLDDATIKPVRRHP